MPALKSHAEFGIEHEAVKVFNVAEKGVVPLQADPPVEAARSEFSPGRPIARVPLLQPGVAREKAAQLGGSKAVIGMEAPRSLLTIQLG